MLSLQRLTKGQNSWSLSEVVHAIVLLAHYHSLSSFVFSCGLTQELDGASHKIENNNVLTQKTAFNRLNDLYNSQHPENLPNGDDGKRDGTDYGPGSSITDRLRLSFQPISVRK